MGMEDRGTFYKTIAKKSDLDIMFIIENPDDYDKEYYCAAVKIGLQRGIISNSDFDPEYRKELNENISEIVAKENAKPKKPFNFLLNGFLILVCGFAFYAFHVTPKSKSIEDYFGISFILIAYIAFLVGVIFLITGLVRLIKRALKCD